MWDHPNIRYLPGIAVENVEAFKEEMGLLLNKMQRVVTTTGMMDATEGDGEAEVQATARLYVLNTLVRGPNLTFFVGWLIFQEKGFEKK